MLIVVGPEHLIAVALVGKQKLQRGFPQEFIHLDVRIGGGPVDGPAKLFHGTGGPLNEAVARLATLQSLDVITIERKILQVRKLWRIAEQAEGQIAGKLAKPVEIVSIQNVSFRSSMDVDRTKQEYLGRDAGGRRLRHGLSIPDGGDLILIQSDALPEKHLQVGI